MEKEVNFLPPSLNPLVCTQSKHNNRPFLSREPHGYSCVEREMHSSNVYRQPRKPRLFPRRLKKRKKSYRYRIASPWRSTRPLAGPLPRTAPKLKASNTGTWFTFQILEYYYAHFNQNGNIRLPVLGLPPSAYFSSLAPPFRAPQPALIGRQGLTTTP